MSVTVAVVVLNAADEMVLTLESVIHQSYRDREILVVDGSSWDESPKVIERYRKEIDRVEVIEDGGIYPAMNAAAAMAKGEFIIFMNAGDRFYGPDSLSRMCARKRDGADVVYGNHIYRRDRVDHFRVASDMSQIVDALCEGDVNAVWLDRFPAHQATLTRTALLRQLRYDTSFRIVADHDFLLRAAHAGADIQYVDELVAVYMAGGVSLAHHELCKLEWNALYRRFSENPDRVDAFFFDHDTPFLGMRSPMSGECVFGLFPADSEDADAPRHVSAEGMRLVSPEHRSVAGLYLTGRNELSKQVLSFEADGETVATAQLPNGDFAVEVSFAPAIAPKTLIGIRPKQAARLEDSARIASFSLIDFTFLFAMDVAPRKALEIIEFNLGAAGDNAELLGGGWWPLETTHVWSRGRVSELRLASSDPVGQLLITARGNPSLPEQELSIAVNGEVAQHATVTPQESEIFVPVRNGWRQGDTNRVTLRTSEAANVGHDPRDLGIALVAVEFR